MTANIYQNTRSSNNANVIQQKELTRTYIFLLAGIPVWPIAVLVLWKMWKFRQFDDSFAESHYIFQYYTSLYYLISTALISIIGLAQFVYIVNFYKFPADELRGAVSGASNAFYIVFLWAAGRVAVGLYKTKKGLSIGRPASAWIWP